MLTWGELKEIVEAYGVQDDDLVQSIDIKGDIDEVDIKRELYDDVYMVEIN